MFHLKLSWTLLYFEVVKTHGLYFFRLLLNNEVARETHWLYRIEHPGIDILPRCRFWTHLEFSDMQLPKSDFYVERRKIFCPIDNQLLNIFVQKTYLMEIFACLVYLEKATALWRIEFPYLTGSQETLRNRISVSNI